MNGHGEKWSRKKEQAIVALLGAPTLIDAAKNCDISQSTLRRWMQEPAFVESYRRAREQLLEAAINKLFHSTYQAAAVLLEVSKNKRATSSSRVSAARAILEIAMKAQEFHELESRIAELENWQATQTD
jgi:transposase-like protein